MLKLFQHFGAHCGHHLQSEYEVGEARKLGIKGRAVGGEHCVPSGVEPHGLEGLEEMSGCHFMLSFD